MAIATITGSFTSTGQSLNESFVGKFNVSLSGFGTATVALQRSFDSGVTWKTVQEYTSDAENIAEEPEGSIQYRLNCTSYTSGTIVYRVSR